MAEVLTLVSIPHILSTAYKFISFALAEIEGVEDRNSQCKLVLRRCTDLVDDIAKHNADGTLPDTFRQNVICVESACKATYAAIHELSGRHFLWRVTHKGVMDDVLKSAEEATTTAYLKFNIGAQADAYRFQQEFTRIRKEESEKMDQLFEKLMQRPDEMVVELQKDGPRTLRIEELALSLTKFIQFHRDTCIESSDPADRFLVAATSKVQQLSGLNQSVEIPSWSVTTMEVRVDRKNLVGRGSFGSIYRGEWNGENVAVKEMHPEDARTIDRQKMKAVQREISIWSNLRNPHILAFYGACLEASQPFILTQFCEHGNILDYLQNTPDADRLRLVHEISLGMTYLHDKRVIHSDLKAANVLISDDGKALIADFGLSRLQDQVSSRSISGHQQADSSLTGSLRWMSPERLSGSPDDFGSDVYSFAVTAWEIYSGQVPFALMPNALVLAKVRDKQERLDRPALLTSDHLWELVELCWHAHPAIRPPFKFIQSRLKPLIISVPSFHISTPPTPIPTSPKSLSAPLLSPWSSHHAVHRRNLSDKLDPASVAVDDRSLDLPPRTPLQPLMDVNSRASDNKCTSTTNELPLLLAQLQRGYDVFSTLSRLERLTHNDSTRNAMTMMPDLLSELGRYLHAESSDVKELTTACLMNITWDEAGRRSVVSCPGILPPLVKLLWQGSSMARENAARCLNRLATIDEGQALILKQDDIILSFANLLNRWSSSKEKEQSAKCFACLSCIGSCSYFFTILPHSPPSKPSEETGQRAIMAERNIIVTLLNALPHSSTEAKQNITRCMANLATNSNCVPELLNHPPLIGAMRSLLAPDIPILELEQAIRCLQYIAHSSLGQVAVVNDGEVLDALPRLLAHENANVQKHAAACCRNLCQTLNGANRLFLQRGLAYNLKSILLNAPSDVRRYAVEIFERTMDNITRGDPEFRLQNVPFRHDRQSFLLSVEDLINHSPSQQLCVRCLRRLCSETTNQDSVRWMLEIRDRPALLLSLAKLTSGELSIQLEAAQCLAYVSPRHIGPANMISSPEIIDELARALRLGAPETKLAVAECLTNLAKGGGKDVLQRHVAVVQALTELTRSQLTHAEIKVQAGSCLQILNGSQASKRVSLFRRIF